MKKFLLNNTEYQQKVIRQRLYLSLSLVILLILVFLWRLFDIQVLQFDHFQTLSQENRVKVLPIPPIRGLIYSREGSILADNYSSFSLELTPEKISDFEKTVKILRRFINITDDDITRYEKIRSKKRKFEPIPLKNNLSQNEVAKLSVNAHRLDGVEVVARLNRYYPHGKQTVHSIGYVARIGVEDLNNINKANYSGTSHIGKVGIEKFYESKLHGDVGYQQVEVNAQGRILRVLDRKPPKSGNNLYLTLDLSLQQLAQKEMQDKRGAIVAMDPNNGDILAFVSSPSYDPNLFVNGIGEKAYKSLLDSNDRPLINRVLNGKYPPGSTFKPFLGYAALEQGIANSRNTVWCPGWFSLKGSSHRYRDWKKQGHGSTNLPEAIMESCDVYFYSLAYNMGIDKIHEYLNLFSFGRPTGIDIHGESRALLPSRDWKRAKYNQPWYPGETVIVGIGQGYALVTPLQLAVATSAIANRGKVYLPRLVASESNAEDNSVIQHEPVVSSIIGEPDSTYWQTIIDSMRDVVHHPNGTAKRSGYGAEYQFAGKTGTAQVISIAQDAEYDEDEIAKELQDHAWFIAFAPVENPVITAVILVENGGSGSGSAAPIARRLFDHYLKDRINLSEQ